MENKKERKVDINNNYYYYLKLLAYEELLSLHSFWADSSDFNTKIKCFILGLKEEQLKVLKNLNLKCFYYRNEFKEEVILDFYTIDFKSDTTYLYSIVRNEQGIVLRIKSDLVVKNLLEVFINAKYDLTYKLSNVQNWNHFKYVLDELILYFAVQQEVFNIFKKSTDYKFVEFLKEEYLLNVGQTRKSSKGLSDTLAVLKC